MSKNLTKFLALLIALSVSALNSGLFSYSYNVALAASEEGLEESLTLPIREQSRNKQEVTPDQTQETNTVEQVQSIAPKGDGASKVTICHLTAGNPNNAHTIEVSVNALEAHLAHGDTMGVCSAPVDHCAALMQNIKNFQGVHANIKNGTYDAAFDLDADDAINLSDVVIATAAQPSADVNGDGVVNLTDVVLAAQCVNSDPVHQYCSVLVQNIKNFQGVHANIKNGTYDAAFDLDADGAINLSDVVIATAAQPSADVNGDGVVNLTDVVLAAQCHFEVPQLEQPQIQNPPRNNPEINNVAIIPPTEEQCHALIADMEMVQSADHSLPGDLNGDHAVNLTDTVLLAELDRGGQNGVTDKVINLTDVVLLAQFCHDFIPAENPVALTETTPANPGNSSGSSDSYIVPTPTLQPQVLSEQVNASNCKVDKDVANKTKFANGTLLRACNAKIYLIKDGQKLYIENLATLKKYAGKRIYNVSQDVLDSYPDWTPKVSAIKPKPANQIVKSSIKSSK
ncbi:MAG: dockerin type I domain-containing protein [Patescibacteria group bacterium]